MSFLSGQEKLLYEIDLCQLLVAFVMMRNQTQISQT